MLSGTLPFPASDIATVLRGHLESEPPPLHSVPGGKDGKLASLVAAMLAKDGRLRPDSGHRVSTLLSEISRELAKSDHNVSPRQSKANGSRDYSKSETKRQKKLTLDKTPEVDTAAKKTKLIEHNPQFKGRRIVFYYSVLCLLLLVVIWKTSSFDHRKNNAAVEVKCGAQSARVKCTSAKDKLISFRLMEEDSRRLVRTIDMKSSETTAELLVKKLEPDTKYLLSYETQQGRGKVSFATDKTRLFGSPQLLLHGRQLFVSVRSNLEESLFLTVDYVADGNARQGRSEKLSLESKHSSQRFFLKSSSTDEGNEVETLSRRQRNSGEW